MWWAARCLNQRYARSARADGRSPSQARADQSVSFDLVEFYHNRAHLIGVDSNKFEPAELSTIMIELNRGFESGKLQPPNIEAAPFEHAIAAYEKTQAGGTKQILVI